MRSFTVVYAVGNEAAKVTVLANEVSIYRNNDGVFTDVTFKGVKDGRYVAFAPRSVRSVTENV